jgi:hypothetical protein
MFCTQAAGAPLTITSSKSTPAQPSPTRRPRFSPVCTASSYETHIAGFICQLESRRNFFFVRGSSGILSILFGFFVFGTDFQIIQRAVSRIACGIIMTSLHRMGLQPSVGIDSAIANAGAAVDFEGTQSAALDRTSQRHDIDLAARSGEFWRQPDGVSHGTPRRCTRLDGELAEALVVERGDAHPAHAQQCGEFRIRGDPARAASRTMPRASAETAFLNSDVSGRRRARGVGTVLSGIAP